MSAAFGTRERVLEEARKELGTVEHPPGSNRQEFGQSYTMNGVAWCAQFVWEIFRRAKVPLEIKTAYTPALAAVYQKAKLWLPNTSKAVQPGDIVLFYWTHMRRIAHTGIVEVVNANGTLTCIEGNTDARGGRTGGKVMRQIRSRATIHPNGGFATPVFEEDDMGKPEQDALKRIEESLTVRQKGKKAIGLDKYIAQQFTAINKRLDKLEAK